MSDKSETSRLEAFCDGVFAIAITLLILEIKTPPLASIHSVRELQDRLLEGWPAWFGYVLSFLIILISWVNHHSAFKLIDRSSLPFIYANGFLLLTLAVVSYTFGLMAEYLNTDFAQPAVSLYCVGVLLHNVAWVIWGWTLTHPYVLARDAKAQKVLHRNLVRPSRFAFLIYLGICILSFWFPVVAMTLMTASWIFWIITSVALGPKVRPSA